MKYKINPLIIILLNGVMPLMNSFIPSRRLLLFSIIFSLFLLIVMGKYKRLLKFIVFFSVFFLFYKICIMMKIGYFIVSIFKMSVLFLPCLVLSSILIFDFNSSEILSALEKLRLNKVFIICLTVTLRYIPTFKREFKIIREAMTVRGIKFSIRNPIRTFEYLIVPQLFRCLALSSELTASGITKGIMAPNRRTSYFSEKLNIIDFIIIAIFFIGCGLSILKVNG